MAQERGLDNFTILTSHKLILPAMRALLESGDVPIDGFLCPGHVAVIVGADVFGQIVREYHQPCVIAGFEGPQIAAALARLTEMVAQGRPALENLYSQAVTPQGNRIAQQLIDRFFVPADWEWRGLGMLKGSGLALRPEFARFDARNRFGLGATKSLAPQGCRCGDIITGRLTPPECALFGVSCNPFARWGPAW